MVDESLISKANGKHNIWPMEMLGWQRMHLLLHDPRQGSWSWLAILCIFFYAGKRREIKRQKLLNLGILNMLGCGMDEIKCIVLELFKERKLDILALSETKVKGSDSREWKGQRIIFSGVFERY